MDINKTEDYTHWLKEVVHNPYLMGFIPDELKCEQFYIEAVSQNGFLITRLKEQTITASISLAAVKQDENMLKNIKLHIESKDDFTRSLTIANDILSLFNKINIAKRIIIAEKMVLPTLRRVKKADSIGSELHNQLAIFIEHADRLQFNTEKLSNMIADKKVKRRSAKFQKNSILSL